MTSPYAMKSMLFASCAVLLFAGGAQAQTVGPDAALATSTGSQIISNIDSVHISGFELETQYHPADGLTLFGNVGTTDTDINRSGLYPGYVGNHTPKTVPYKLDLGAQYLRPLGDGWSAFGRIDYEHRDKEYWQIDNANVQKALDLVNGRVGLTKSNYGIYFWARNLTNERYYEDYNPSKWSGLPYDIGSLAEPRSYGLELQVRY